MMNLKINLLQRSLVFSKLLAWQVFIYVLFRLAFYLYFRGDDYPVSDLLYSFYMGAKFDLRIIALSCLPTMLFLFLPHKWYQKFLHPLNLFLLCLLQMGMITAYFIDFAFFAYLRTRVNSTMLDLAENFAISFNMVWETYPFIRLLLGIIVLTVGYFFLLNKRVFNTHLSAAKNKKIAFLDRFIVFLFFAFSVYGKLAWYPLRWSEAFFTPNQFVTQLTLNPIINFYRTVKYKAQSYDPKLVEYFYPQIKDYLNLTEEDPSNPYLRSFPAKERPFKPNIIFIQLESLAANKTSVFQNELDPTPYLKQIADEGLFFPNFFTPTEATARGVFATITGVPDLAPTKSSSRNPLAVNHHTIFNEFKDYQKFYFLGGSANWGNIRSIFTYNIDDIKIYEEGDYTEDRVDVWGISDLSLFKEAHQVLEKTTHPFIAFIQSSSFHRPHTLPKKRGEFKERKIPIDQLRNNGFLSNKQFNSLRFQDYALGDFFKRFKKSKYYQNTILVLFGDHGLPSLKSQNMPKGYYRLRLVHHHVPLIIYGPKEFVTPGVNQSYGGLQDIMPTVADMSGIAYRNTTLGTSLISRPKNQTFIFSWHLKPKLIGMISDQFYYQDTPSKNELFLYKSENPLENVAEKYPKEFEEYKNLTNAIYETSRFWTFKNHKLKN